MAEDQFVEYVSELLSVNHKRSLYNDNDRTTLEQERQDELSEEIMAKIEEYMGDGTARVTVSADLGSSVSYHSAKAFVSISVPCNNDMDSIYAVHEILRPHVQGLCGEDHEAMAAMRDGLINPTRAPAETKSQVRQPPKRGGSQGPKGPAKRGGKTVTPKGVKKPSFRR